MKHLEIQEEIKRKKSKVSWWLINIFIFWIILVIGTNLYAYWQVSKSVQNKLSYSNVLIKEFKWFDHNGYLDSSSSTHNKYFKVRIPISKDMLNEAIQSYGAPEEWFNFTYINLIDRIKKQVNLRKRLADRGINYIINENKLALDYNWMITKSFYHTQQPFDVLYQESKKNGYNDARKIFGFFSSFVQNIPYGYVPEWRKGPSGEKIYICGITMPLETLANGFGDCDTKSVLFASLMRHFRNVKVVFIELENHLFVGVRMTPKRGEYYIRYRLGQYVLIEMSNPWPMGMTDENIWRQIKMRRFKTYRVV